MKDVQLRFGDEYLTRLGERGDSCCDVHRDAAEVARLSLDFSGVNARPNAELIQLEGTENRGSAANGPRCSVEHG